jgi:IclR family transcriptional regulator, KDG regulon repressor
MIRAVERALAIFDAFDAQHQSLTLLEIGERIGMPKATTFRLVNTLVNGGFLVRLDDHRYSLSLKILRFAVCRATGETVTLNLRSGYERICVDVVDTPSPLMTIVRPGEHVSLLRGATARSLLAYAKPAEINEIISKTARPEAVNITELKAALAEIRRQGYAHTSSQRIRGVTAVAVPIFDINNDVHYSLAITGPSIRMDPRLNEFKQILIDAGASISATMGASTVLPFGNNSAGSNGASQSPSRSGGATAIRGGKRIAQRIEKKKPASAKKVTSRPRLSRHPE